MNARLASTVRINKKIRRCGALQPQKTAKLAGKGAKKGAEKTAHRKEKN